MYNNGYRNSIMPNYGQLSFRQGQTRAVGLPLEVIDKVGASMTANYHRNRQAFSKMQADVLNLPDSNSEGNKKIIEEMTQEVKSAFSEYEKEDNWWNADDAVYNTLDKITSDPRVKDLQSYYGQYSKVEKQIEDSGASEYYKNIRRAMNQVNNKGIRGDNGERLSYQGKGLAGDLDMMKYVKEFADMTNGWKADKTYKLLGGSAPTVNFQTTEGYNNLVMAYGKETIESVPLGEIESFAYKYVANNPKYQAELADLAELSLFAKTGKIEATPEAVVSLMTEEASSNPDVIVSFITGSKEFVDKTKNMDGQQRSKYLSSIMNNPDATRAYVSAGIQNTIDMSKKHLGDNPQAYKDAYTSVVAKQMFSMFDDMARKNSYTQIDGDMKYDDLSINGKLFDQFLKQTQSYPIMYESGQFDAKNAKQFLENRDDFNSQLSAMQSEYDSPNTSKLRKEALANQISSLQSRINANDLILNSIKKEMNINPETLKEAVIKDVFSPYRRNLEKSFSWDSRVKWADRNNVPGGLDFSINPNSEYDKITKEQATAVYDILSSNKNADYNSVKSELAAKKIPLSAEAFRLIKYRIEDSSNNIISKQLDNYSGSFSLPIETLGYVGDSPEEFTNLNNLFLKQYMNNANYEVLWSPDKDREGISGLGDKSFLYHQEKKNGQTITVANDIQIEPVKFRDDSSVTSAMPTYRIIITDPSKNPGENQRQEIVRFKSGIPATGDMYSNMVARAAKSTVSSKGTLPDITYSAAKQYSALYAGSIPVVSVGDKNLGGELNVAAAIEYNKPDNLGNYPEIKFGLENYPLTIKTYKNKVGAGYRVMLTQGTNVIHELTNTLNPSEILEYAGADIIHSRLMSKGDYQGAAAVGQIFKIKTR